MTDNLLHYGIFATRHVPRRSALASSPRPSPELLRSMATRVPIQPLARARVATWLKSHHRTQTALAAAIGRKPNWVSRWLAGGYDADVDALAAMAEFFGNTLDQLCGPPDRWPSDPALNELCALWPALPPAAREALLSTARAVAALNTD